MKLNPIHISEYNIFDEILSNVNDGINMVNLDGILIYTNKLPAENVNFTINDMIGRHINDFYPNALLLRVLETKKPILEEKIHLVGNIKYVASSYPIFINEEFCGAYTIFRSIEEIDQLNKKVKYLELQINLNKPEQNIYSIIGITGSLEKVIIKAKRTVGSLGGPRHSIITGQSGTGKTMLANLIYSYAKEIGVINKNAPFIEVNCAQFTNPDLAAVEIFGSEKGAFTGSVQKKGLFEQADGGILFLDEAHALEQYQTMLLKAIESGSIRRVGGIKEIAVDVIIISASTKNLKEVLLPELYQRLAQYEMYLPSLDERSQEEKLQLLDYFINKYETLVKETHRIKLKVEFSDHARNLILNATYPRNIRQFRDIINASIDAASPLISDILGKKNITIRVADSHIPFSFWDHENDNIKVFNNTTQTNQSTNLDDIITKLRNEGLGPRKISRELKKYGHNLEYYQIAYYLKKNCL